MAAKIIEQGILLTFDEIRVLLCGLGKTEVEGVYMEEKEFGERDVLTAMHRLSDAGFITAGEDRFTVREDVRRILEIAASPEATEIWRPRGDEGPAYFLYYAGDFVVLSERFWRRKDTIRYTLAGREEFARIRKEYADDDSGGRDTDHRETL